MSNVISLAAVCAARQAQQAAHATPPEAPEPPPPPLRWQQSARGNWWTRDDARGGLHLVIYETTQGWRGRATTPGG
jgi:hypothetical protein